MITQYQLKMPFSNLIRTPALIHRVKLIFTKFINLCIIRANSSQTLECILVVSPRFVLSLL